MKTVKSSEIPVPVVARSGAETKEGYASEADFDDTIARNRALALVSPNDVPMPTQGFLPTDPDVRKRRLRRLADEDRPEGVDALQEGARNDLRGDFGKHAPDPKKAAALVERVTQTGALVMRAKRLLQFAKEMDEIALSDALVFLEAENKEFEHLVGREPDLVEKYAALKRLFDGRAAAIVEGIERKKAAEEAEKAAAKGAKEAKKVKAAKEEVEEEAEEDA